MDDGRRTILSRGPDQLDADSPVAEDNSVSKRSGSSDRLHDDHGDAKSSRDVKAAQVASTEGEPKNQVTVRAPLPLPAASSETGRAYYSQIAWRQKKTEFPAQSLARWESWCDDHQMTFKAFATALMEDGFAKLLSTGRFPESAYQGTQFQPPEGPNRGTKVRKPAYQGTHSYDPDLRIDNDDQSSSDRSDLFPESAYQGTEISPDALAKENAVLGFYQSKTGNRIRPSDRLAYRYGYKNRRGEYAPGAENVQAHLIRRGIIQSIERCAANGGQVGMFAYCLGAINQLAADAAREQAVADDERINALKETAAQRGNQEMLPGTGAELQKFEPGIPERAVTVFRLRGADWPTVFGKLSGRLGKQTSATWFQSLRSKTIRDVTEVTAPNVVIRDWIVASYGRMVTEAASEIPGCEVEWPEEERDERDVARVEHG